MQRKGIATSCGVLVLSATVLSACATSPEDISATYVSPMQYQSYDCDQLAAEMRRVSSRVREVTGAQESESTKDAVALGVGMILFWPALFFMIGDDQEEELARLKGEYQALEQRAIAEDCGFAPPREASLGSDSAETGDGQEVVSQESAEF